MSKRKKSTVDSWSMSDRDYIFLLNLVENHHIAKNHLKEMEYDIIYSSPGMDDNGGGRSNIPGRPTERIVSTLEQNILLQRLKAEIYAVDKALAELDAEKRRFVEYVFWGTNRHSVQKIMQEFNIAAITQIRWKKAFLLRVGSLTGYYRGDLKQFTNDK